MNQWYASVQVLNKIIHVSMISALLHCVELWYALMDSVVLSSTRSSMCACVNASSTCQCCTASSNYTCVVCCGVDDAYVCRT